MENLFYEPYDDRLFSVFFVFSSCYYDTVLVLRSYSYTVHKNVKTQGQMTPFGNYDWLRKPPVVYLLYHVHGVLMIINDQAPGSVLVTVHPYVL